MDVCETDFSDLHQNWQAVINCLTHFLIKRAGGEVIRKEGVDGVIVGLPRNGHVLLANAPSIFEAAYVLARKFDKPLDDLEILRPGQNLDEVWKRTGK